MFKIENLWNDIIKQNREALLSYFHEDAVIRRHCSNEQFSVKQYVKINCDYPGEWCGEIERTEYIDDTVILVGRVYSFDEAISHHVTSFIKINEDKIIEMDEYRACDGDVPDWRKKLGIGRPIK